MKKGILFSVAVVCLLLLAGCGNSKSKLNCKMTVSGVDIDLNVGFTGNNIDAMDLKYYMDLSSYSDIQVDAIKKQDFCNSVKNVMGDLKESFSNCKQNVEDKKLSVTADFDIDKISDDKKKKMQSPDDAKNDLEKTGYKCTLEK